LRVIIAGVGYRNLRDHSIGVEVADRLEKTSWTDAVVVEDLSYNPIAVVQRLEDEPPEQRFQRVVVVGAVERGRQPGTVAAYRWNGVLPTADEIHRAVTEAVTGVISLDNTLVVTRHFGALPDDVVVVEVEPAVQEFGDTFSEVVGRQLNGVCELVSLLATHDDAVEQLPRSPLGGPAHAGASAS